MCGFAIEVSPNQLIHSSENLFPCEREERWEAAALKLRLDVGAIFLSELEADIGSRHRPFGRISLCTRTSLICAWESTAISCPGREIDPRAVYQKLKDTCYDGPVSLDIYLQDYAGCVRPRCLDYINGGL